MNRSPLASSGWVRNRQRRSARFVGIACFGFGAAALWIGLVLVACRSFLIEDRIAASSPSRRRKPAQSGMVVNGSSWYGL